MKTLYINGNIYTMALDNKKAQGFVEEDGKIIYVGDNKNVLEYKDINSDIVDLESRTIIPGFNDSHIHLLNYAYSLEKIDLSNCKSIDEIVEISKKYIIDNNIKAGDWVLGRGWSDVFLKEGRNLYASDLDRISRDHPICFTRICEHTVSANTLAMNKGNIDKNTAMDKGGKIVKDTEGNPIGLFRETARYLIYDIIPDKSIDDIKRMISMACDDLVKVGITSVQPDDFEAFPSKNFEYIIKAYRELVEEDKLPVRVYQQCLLPTIERFNEFHNKGYRYNQGDERYRIGPLKLLIDGSLGPRTAYLRENYSDDIDNRGVLGYSQEELNEFILLARKGNIPVVMHAIGDATIEICSKAIENANNIYPDVNHRSGIIHLQTTTPELIDKMKENNIVAYIEPVCMSGDMHMAGDRLGDRINLAYDYKMVIDKGLKYCMSSDSPVDSYNPLDGIYLGVVRKDYNGWPEDSWYPEKSITVEDAVYGYTMGSAYASFEEDIKGSIEIGKYADFIILSEDIFEIDPNRIKDVKVIQTVMNGQTTYKMD